MEDEWYYRLFGEEFGPLRFDELAALAKCDGLGPVDPVRHGREGRWVPAAMLSGLFAQPRSPVAAGDEHFYLLVEDTEYGPIDADQLQRMAVAGRLRTYQRIRRGRAGEWLPLTIAAEGLGLDAALIRSPLPVPVGAPGTVGGGPGASTSSGAEAAVSDEAPAGAIAAAALAADSELAARQTGGAGRRRRLTAIWLGAGAAAALATLLAVLMFGTSDREHYESIWSLYEQVQALREQNAPPERWNEWAATVEGRQRELVPELEATAGAERGRVARQHLLFALRDYLGGMQRDSIGEPGESERKFREHMESALAYVEGRPPARASRPTSASAFGPMEIALAMTALVEVAIVLWLAAGLIRSPRHQPM